MTPTIHTQSAAPSATLASFDTFFEAKARTADAMRDYGGGFVSSLANALARADRDNARRLYDAFADLLIPYAPGGRFHK